MQRSHLLFVACFVLLVTVGIPTASAGVLETTGRTYLGDDMWETHMGCSIVDATFTISPGGVAVDPEVRPECIND